MANLDRSYVQHYLEDWLKYVRESAEAEQKLLKTGKEYYVPFSGIQENMIKTIIVLSDRYEIEPQGKYVAIHLLDRYLCNLFGELITTALTSSSSSGSSKSYTSSTLTAHENQQLPEFVVRQVREKISSQIKLALAVCLQIASKDDLYKTGLCISQVQEVMQMIEPEHEYSKCAITAYEVRVLTSLDFKLPRCVPLNTVELFLVHLEMTEPCLRKTCLQLLDLAYMCHNEIFSQLYLMAHGEVYNKAFASRNFLGLEMNSAFIGASIVVCSGFFHHLERSIGETISAKLAKLIGASPIDIIILANIIFTHAIDELDYETLKENPGEPAKPVNATPQQTSCSSSKSSQQRR